MLVEGLVWLEYIWTTLETKKEEWKEWLRMQLGPSPNRSFYIFANNDVIPSTMQCKLPEDACKYSPEKHQLRSWHEERPLQKVPWLSLQCKVGDELHDFSDWVSSLRVDHSPSLLSILRLAALIHNLYIPEEHCKVDVITRTGEEESYFIRNNQAKKEVILNRKETLPFDGPMFF